MPQPVADCCFYAVIGCVLEKPTPFPGLRPCLGGLASQKAAGAHSTSRPTALRKNGHRRTGRRTAKNGCGSKHLARLGATRDGLRAHCRRNMAGFWGSSITIHPIAQHTRYDLNRAPTRPASWRPRRTDSR
ncbi:hypothetical protein CTAM01_17162 [Colletotrichum tamarilloi]|uniref:Uncharacterized protein n=1 Tax=Colletotrichum tamarilloi TaxID=1209934 RepID=A0ABQ9QGF1_9PEZI|nr:uncharacterized protein CTAM01_17162 [Colletotrichum tamarilloi]KAK1458634.1 hypothetical protein CTAM01_17162 [Colletotrichum tamarilloi]